MPADANASDAERQLLEKYEAAEDPASVPVGEAKVATPPSTPAAVAATEAPKFPKHLLRKAKQYGIDDDDLADMSADELRDEIADRRADRSDQRVAAALNAAGRPYDPQTGRLLPQDTPAGAHANPPPGSGTPSPAGDTPRAPGLGITADDLEKAGYTGDLLPVLERAVKPLVDEIARLRGQTDQLAKSDQHRNNREGLSMMDRWFSKHKDVYGDGSLDDLDPDSREYKMRMRLVRDMGAIPANQRSQTPKQDFDKVHKELTSLFPAPAPQPEPKTGEVAAADTNGTHNRIGDKFKTGGLLKPTEDVPTVKGKKGYANAVGKLEAVLKQKEVDRDDPPEEADLAD